MEPPSFNHLLVETRVCSRISCKFILCIYSTVFFFSQHKLKLIKSTKDAAVCVCK